MGAPAGSAHQSSGVEQRVVHDRGIAAGVAVGENSDGKEEVTGIGGEVDLSSRVAEDCMHDPAIRVSATAVYLDATCRTVVDQGWRQPRHSCRGPVGRHQRLGRMGRPGQRLPLEVSERRASEPGRTQDVTSQWREPRERPSRKATGCARASQARFKFYFGAGAAKLLGNETPHNPVAGARSNNTNFVFFGIFSNTIRIIRFTIPNGA